MKVEEYFSDAQSWDSGYEGHGGNDPLTWCANRFFRSWLLRDRLANTLELCRPIPGRTFLDVACGSGRISFALAGEGAEKVTGFDVNETMIALARSRSRQSESGTRVEFVVSDLENPPVTANVAVLIGILSYLPDFRVALRPLLSNRPEAIVLQFLPRRWHGWRHSLIHLGSVLWGKIRRLSIYRHDQDEVDRYLADNGYRCDRSFIDGNGVLSRYTLR